MNIAELIEIFKSAFNSGRCMEYLNKINENDRYFNFPAFEKTALNCAEFMRKAGLEDIELLPVMADGRTTYGDWLIPKAWDAEYAVLKSADEDCVIFADYKETPCSLAMYSAPTPKGGVTAEAVIISREKGKAIEIDVNSLNGKIIVTSEPVGAFVQLAKEAGALGIVSDYIPLYKGVRDDLDDMQDISRWDNSSLAAHIDAGLFAFNISPKNGKLLRNLISQREHFYLTAEVNTRLYDGECYTVSGKIKGETEDSVCIYGHLYEPGAHDNASGCALILELASCINELIGKGILPRPKRTLNFVVGYECVGSMAWILAKERNAVCGFVADMMGTDNIDNAHMCIWHSPMSNLSFADAYILNIIEAYTNSGDKFEWESKKFSIGTDNILGDPYFKMPSVAMITEPALSYHSSLDTPDRIERDVIFRNGVIIGAYIFGLAAADTAETEKLWRLTYGYIDNALKSKPEIFKYEILKAARQSIIDFCPEYIPDEIAVCEDNNIFIPAEYAGDKAYLVPKREAAGCLTFASRPDFSDLRWQPAWNSRLNLPLFWADGKRNLWEIAVLSAIEAGESADDMYERWKWLSEYFEFLANNGYLSMQKIIK